MLDNSSYSILICRRGWCPLWFTWVKLLAGDLSVCCLSLLFLSKQMCQARLPIAFQSRPREESGGWTFGKWQASMRFPSLMSGQVILGMGVFESFQNEWLRSSANGSMKDLDSRVRAVEKRWLLDLSCELHKRHVTCGEHTILTSKKKLFYFLIHLTE